MADRLRGRVCNREHEHEPVIGGRRVTEKAGHYPPALAEAMLGGIEEEWNNMYHEANVVGDSDDGYEPGTPREDDPTDDEDFSEEDDGDDPGDQDGGPERQQLRQFLSGGPHAGPEGQDPLEELEDDIPEAEGQPTAADRRMALHLHNVTGHRPPLRLARALVMTGADPMLIKAAKQLRCSMCQEMSSTKTRRPASLPRVRHFGDRLAADLISIQDTNLDTFWVVHMIDLATRFQVAGVLKKKSTEDVLKFMAEGWFQTLGVPASLTTDMGPEFVADEFQRQMDFFDIALYHVPVEAPWMNGVAERAGGSLKAVLRVLIHKQSVAGEYELKLALSAALEAVNNDIDQTGYSPAQMVLGKQPRIMGAADPSSLRSKLASNSMMLQEPQFERILAFKECARMAMVKLHYSRALREASVARPRVQPDFKEFSVGDVVYFFRMQKPVAKKYKHVQRKRLALKRWHGPSVILAIEGSPTSVPISAYVAYRGNVTKVAMEHLRHASALERLVAEDWDAIVQDVLNSVDPGGGGADDGGEVPQLQDGEAEDPDHGQPRDDQGVPIPEPALPMLPEHRPVVQQQVVFPYPYPASLVPMSAAAPSMSAASKLSSRRSSTATTPSMEQSAPVEPHPAPHQVCPS